MSLDHYRKELEAEVGSSEMRRALGRLRQAHSVLGKYEDIDQLLDLGQPGNSEFTDKDEVLAVVLQQIQHDPILFSLLNLMLWPGLMSLYRRYERVSADPEELFRRLQAEFYHTAITYPLDRRPRKVDVNLILDTRKKLFQWQRQEAGERQEQKNLRSNLGEDNRLADLQDRQVFPEEMEAFLLDLVYQGIISQQVYDLLLETRVYRRMSQKDWAAANDVAHATVRSWVHRAEEAISMHIAGKGSA